MNAAPAVEGGPTGARRASWWWREGGAFLELLAVTALTVARPTLGILSNNATIFVERRTTPVQLVALVLILLLVPPLALWLVELVVGAIAPRLRRPAHIVLVTGVAGIFVIEVMKKQTSLASWVLVVLALVGAALAGFLLWRFRAVGLFLRYLAIAPVLFAVLFATSGPVTAAVFESDPDVKPVEVDQPHRVMMVILDELPTTSLLDGQGHIDAGLYPNLAELERGSTWYRNATTVAPFTGKAVPAILTGRYEAAEGDVQTAATAPDNLFTLLGGEYSMNAVESGSQLCPERLCVPAHSQGGLQDLGDLLSISRTLWWEHASPERMATNPFVDDADMIGDPHGYETGEDFLASVGPSGRKPQLDLLHALFPHQGWHYLPSGADYRQNAPARGIWWDFTWGSQWTAEVARQRHLLQAAAADTLVGRIIDKLKAMGEYDDTLLVVTADHGIAFGERVGLRGLSRENYPQIAWVPMFVKAPGQRAGVVDDRNARTTDLVPTIADLLGVKIPWKVDGQSLLGPARPDGPIKLLDWSRNYMEAGKDGFVTLPGPPGFELVKASRATAAPGTGVERLYRIGPYGNLLGREVDPSATVKPAGRVTLDDPDRYEDVDPGASEVPWVYVAGELEGLKDEHPLAITVNGRVAGFSGAYVNPLNLSDVTFSSVVDPRFFHRGDNTVAVWALSGPADDPVLAPLTTR